MKKSVSLLISLSLLGSSLPAMAQDASSSSSESSSSVSSSSSSVSSTSSTASSVRPCADKKDTQKILCLLQHARAKIQNKAKDTRMNTQAHIRNDACKNEKGLKKALCLRKNMKKKNQAQWDTKVQTFEKKIGGRLLKTVIRKRGGSSSSTSSSSSSN